MSSLHLISTSELNKNVLYRLEQRRLKFYSLENLLEIYRYEQKKLRQQYFKLSEFSQKISFTEYFTANSYVSDKEFHRQPIKKEKLIEMIIIFYQTKFLISSYLKQIQENE
ncbi:hypothetical protein [Sulfurimonas sp.]